MALTLFPTKICLKFASVPVPEAHKYVIPPISYGSPFRSTLAPLPSLSLSLSRFSFSTPSPPLRRRLTVTLATPYVFLRGCSSSRQYKGKHGKSFVPKENTMQYPRSSRPRRHCVCLSPLPPLAFLSSPSRSSSPQSPRVSFPVFFFETEEGRGGSREP